MERLYTWDEINNHNIVSWRDREREAHKRRYADDPQYRADCQHWDDVRKKMREGEPIVERHPPLTLAQQADKQIARLWREIGEWETIKKEAAITKATGND